MRKNKLSQFFFLAFLVCTCLCSGAQRQSTEAKAILANARKLAGAEHKNVFLIFGASWCGPCKLMDRFLAVPENHQVIDKYFVVAKLSVAEELGGNPERNTPGSGELLAGFGGPKDEVPFLIMVDPQGSAIITSFRNGDRRENIGYPEIPDEISWFMVMLRKAAPSISSSDAEMIQSSLRKLSRKH